MEIKELEKKENKTILLVKGTNTAFLNAIRRTIMKDVPVFAVENVTIYENSSVMFDEMLAQRIGLIPIKTSLKGYKEKDKIVFSLEKEGPGTVYSKDIKTRDPKIEIVNKRIPITKLGKGQKIRAELEAVMEKGSTHSKWQPIISGFQQVVEIKNEKGCNMCKKCIDACSKNLLEIKAKKVVLKNPYACDLCGQCRDTCKAGVLKMDFSDSTFIMELESVGAMNGKEALLEAINVLKERTGDFKKVLGKA